MRMCYNTVIALQNMVDNAMLNKSSPMNPKIKTVAHEGLILLLYDL